MPLDKNIKNKQMIKIKNKQGDSKMKKIVALLLALCLCVGSLLTQNTRLCFALTHLLFGKPRLSVVRDQSRDAPNRCDDDDKTHCVPSSMLSVCRSMYSLTASKNSH